MVERQKSGKAWLHRRRPLLGNCKRSQPRELGVLLSAAVFGTCTSSCPSDLPGFLLSKTYISILSVTEDRRLSMKLQTSISLGMNRGYSMPLAHASSINIMHHFGYISVISRCHQIFAIGYVKTLHVFQTSEDDFHAFI